MKLVELVMVHSNPDDVFVLWFLKTFRIWARVSAWHSKVKIPTRFLVLLTIDSWPEADEATEDELSGEEESRIYAARKGGAARPAEGSSESCFRMLDQW